MATVICVCGPAGSGKSTVGRAVAAAAGCTFLDADDLHPQPNVDKMRGGVPLTDEDRAPWLAALRARVQEHASSGRRLVLACSALKAAYRRVLEGQEFAAAREEPTDAGASTQQLEGAAAARAGAPGAAGSGVAFVLLIPPEAALRRRLEARQAAGAHFMPASLLGSQLAALERGDPGEWLLVVDDDGPPEQAAAAVLRAWVGAAC